MRKSTVPFAVAVAVAVAVATSALGFASADAHAAAPATQPPASTCERVIAGFGEADTVWDAIAGNPELSVLAGAIESVGLPDSFDVAEPLTVFAADDSVYGGMPANVLESILADHEMLTALLSYSVITGNAMQPVDLATAGTVTTAGGEDITFTLDGDNVVINGGQATICGSAEFGTGTILIIDSVLQPPSGENGAPGSSTPGSSVPAFTEEQEAVATAFETAVDSSLTFDEQAPFIEEAEALRDTIENYPTAAEVVMGITAEVTSVAIDGETAAITYVLSFNGVDAGYGDLDGTMALVDGTWVIPHDEYCAFQAQARNNCPD